ncbi:MAG: NADH-quinone oxidoreductase subunit NuoN [Candidatus Aramenus sulfurataquae]|uniref:NADH-quinone oxidoreductase subunit NuoN n=5 Tax=Candidatus Aramenus sulfurataquae TaxID=1326980 RepID=A0AAE3FLL5_9CREN|nr:NADH-quinone oxidoreductase subunit NuoN [Candidatus Aramenus sulfurataquae]
MMLLEYLSIVIPSIVLVFSSLAVLFLDVGTEKSYKTSYYLTLASLVLVVVALMTFFGMGVNNFYLFSYTIRVDVVGYFLSIATALGAIVSLMGAEEHLESWKTRSSMLSLSLLTVLGVIYMAFSNNVIVILTGWAIASAASYAIAMLRKDYGSVVAGIKYLVMGLISSSFMIAGFAAYSLGAGTLQFNFTSIPYPSLFSLGLVLISVSFLFKIGAFPFQGWLPDVYTGADRISVSFISSVGKMVGVVPLVRVLLAADPVPLERTLAVVVFSLVSILSMTIGNVIAFSRKDVASILSFSSVSQMGFVIIGFATLLINQGLAVAGIIVQMIAYVIAQAGLFNFVNHVEKVSGTSELRGLRGLSSKDKGLAVSSTILLLSLLGIPPILGFWGKLFLFLSAFNLPWLVVIAVINSAISAGYYIPVIREMFREGEEFRLVRSSERDSVIFASTLSIALGLIAPLLLVVVS